MGERHGDAGPFLGTSLDVSLGALLAAVRTAPVDPDAEGRAVAAYRAARERGAHGARTRRRDDWTDLTDLTGVTHRADGTSGAGAETETENPEQAQAQAREREPEKPE
ncbi:hypothetical protein [Streptomyces sp. NPDC006333]|uniref:hypothetical protein n=1 Tax=Streptomyces sp. NPDC006333 TaxID=3156753 RepID=UPI0033ABB038